MGILALQSQSIFLLVRLPFFVDGEANGFNSPTALSIETLTQTWLIVSTAFFVFFFLWRG